MVVQRVAQMAEWKAALLGGLWVETMAASTVVWKVDLMVRRLVASMVVCSAVA
jgi:hypothetical protein